MLILAKFKQNTKGTHQQTFYRSKKKHKRVVTPQLIITAPSYDGNTKERPDELERQILKRETQIKIML